MKRLLLCLVPWMVTTAAVAGDTPEPAEVVYTHVGSTRNGVFRVGDDCFVHPDSVASWGWSIAITGNLADVQAEGMRFKVPVRLLNGQKLLPLQPALKTLRAGFAWRPNSDILDVWGVAESIEVLDGRVIVESTLAAKPKIFTLKSPSRLVVDLVGVKLDEHTRSTMAPGARFGQFKSDVVRVVVGAEFATTAPNYRPTATRRFEYLLNASPDPGEGSITPPIEPGPVDRPPDQNLDPIGPPQGAASSLTVRASVPEVLSDTAEGMELRLALSGPLPSPANFRRVDSATLAIWLPGARLDGNLDAKLKAGGIEAWQVDQAPNGAVVTFKLSRPMGIELFAAGREVRIKLLKPDVGNGKLAGKTIVVDAGHGGHDTGARSPGKDLNEKDLTLAMAKLVSQKLAAQGATVIMTRKTDVFIALGERAAIANRSSADLFVSVHINSTARANKASGSMTFYHLDDPIGQVFADCIQREVGKVSGIPDMGTKSDGMRFTNGFAVLRYAKMPAVLIEVGFINHNSDRARMANKEFQESFSKAVVKGIRIYLGDAKTEETESR